MGHTVTLIEKQFRMTVGSVIRLHRNLLGYTQTELAELVGGSQRQISDMEIGVYAPSLLMYAKLCIALEFEPSQVTDMLRLIKFSELYPKKPKKKTKFKAE